MPVVCCPAVPEHVGGGFVTACYERVTEPDAKCQKCGRPVWFMGVTRGRFVFVQQQTQSRKLETCIRLLKEVLAAQQGATPENERKD